MSCRRVSRLPQCVPHLVDRIQRQEEELQLRQEAVEKIQGTLAAERVILHELRRELRERIKVAFEEEGIEIPFAQQTVWHKSAELSER